MSKPNPSTKRAKKSLEAPEWFFMWTSGYPYITAICGWTRRAVIEEATRSNGESWKKIYQRGGRAVRCIVRPK